MRAPKTEVNKYIMYKQNYFCIQASRVQMNKFSKI